MRLIKQARAALQNHSLAAALAQAPQQGGDEPASEPRDCRSVAEAEVKAAALDRDPRAAVRALEIARACHHHPAAWQAAERLRQLDPENVQAPSLVGTVALDVAPGSLPRPIRPTTCVRESRGGAVAIAK